MCKLDAIYESIEMKHGFVMRDYVNTGQKCEQEQNKKFMHMRSETGESFIG